MSGNVWEWMYDGVSAPKAGIETDPVAPFVTDKRLLRGSSWHDPDNLTVGFRSVWASISSVRNFIGFRVVRSI